MKKGLNKDKNAGRWARLFGAKTGKDDRNRDALAFADTRRYTRKRRKRRAALYSSTGFVVIAIVLIIMLVPAAASAPPDTATAALSAAITAGSTPPQETDAAVAAAPAQTEEATDTAAVRAEQSEEATDAAAPAPISTTAPEPTPVSTTEPEATPAPVSVDDLVGYFVVDTDGYYNEVGYSSNHYDYTDDELYMLAQIIQAEAGGERFEGKIAVGNVVMNRVFCGRFGNTIKKVVTTGQFAYNSRIRPSASSRTAAYDVLHDEYWVIPQNVYFFHSAKPAGENWGSHQFYKKIGNHCFYTERYGGRYGGGGIPPKLFARTYKYAQYGCESGGRVYRIQYMLAMLGYDVKPDGYFGDTTQEALVAFQQSQGLAADGIAGADTVKALIEKSGLREYWQKFCV